MILGDRLAHLLCLADGVDLRDPDRLADGWELWLYSIMWVDVLVDGNTGSTLFHCECEVEVDGTLCSATKIVCPDTLGFPKEVTEKLASPVDGQIECIRGRVLTK